MGAALVGGAWRGQRLGVVHVAGATLGLMAVVCVVWADVEGAPTDGEWCNIKKLAFIKKLQRSLDELMNCIRKINESNDIHELHFFYSNIMVLLGQ